MALPQERCARRSEQRYKFSQTRNQGWFGTSPALVKPSGCKQNYGILISVFRFSRLCFFPWRRRMLKGFPCLLVTFCVALAYAAFSSAESKPLQVYAVDVEGG